MPDNAAEQRELISRLLLEKYEPIAIVGMGVRFPGGNDTVDGFEEFLRSGGSGIGPVPPDRWDRGATPLVRSGCGGFLDGLADFDAKFFNISPKEANYVDPQQRLVLETAWEALESTNVDPSTLRHSNGGVYLGVGSMDYLLETGALADAELDAYLGSGTAHSAVSGRLSYFLGLRGPCISLDTACSSSLVAVHLAVEGLRRRECDFALAGGVNAIHHPATSIVFSEANMLAPDGYCKTFDETADGYSRSEGCGVLVLKRLSDAKRDGDTVLALVRGSAVRQDGESAGLTVPNGTAQEQVMRAALTSAMLKPADIGYVEAHGTGTPLGDPIEMGAISDVFGASHTKSAPMVVASLKTNVGHMEPAAGVGGIVKTVLQLKNATIYPHLNFDAPSGRIPWASYPVTVPTTCQDWGGGPRRALVNSFGFAGTIATVVLEQAPPVLPPTPPSESDRGHVFTLSAKSRASLRLQVRRFQSYLAERPDLPVRDVCHTTNVGRAHFKTRVAGVVRTRDDLAGLLAKLDAGDDSAGEIRKVAFLFTGQGSQYAGMGAALYRQYPVFRRHLDECDRLFAGPLGLSVKELVVGDGDELIHQTRYTQPALFALEYSLAKLWLSWGVRPNALLGHSIGEIVAATVAGLFRLEDAVTLVAARGRLMQSVSRPGGMVAVTAAAEDVAPLIEGHPELSFAAMNAPQQCVVSGSLDALDPVVAALTERGVRTQKLAVSHAFHSPLMASVYDEFRDAIKDIRFGDPEFTLVSAVTGKVARPADVANHEYWVRHIGEPVNFLAAMRAVEKRGRHVFVEMGPSAALTGLGKRCVTAGDHRWFASQRPSDEDGSTIAASVAALYAAGLPVSWSGYHEGHAALTVALPTYAFDRRRHWLPVGTRRASSAAAPSLLGVEQPTADGREFVAALDPDQPAYLAGHQAMGQVVFPAAGYVEILLALQETVYGETGRAITDLRIHQALFLPAEIRTRLRPRPDGSASVEIVSRVAGSDGPIERLHVTATIADRDVPGLGLEAPEGAPDRVLDAEDVYAGFREVGMDYGPAFQKLARVARYGSLAVGDVISEDTPVGQHLPPAILDAALQVVGAVVETDEAHLPVRFQAVRFHRKPMGGELRCLLRVTPSEPDDVADADFGVDLALLAGDRPVVALTGVGYKRVAGAVPGARRRVIHELAWVSRPLPDTAREDRHLLAIGAPGPLASAAGTTKVTYASSADEVAAALADGPTDVAWFWRPDGAGLRDECERNYRDLLGVLRVLDSGGFGRNQRLWLVTEGAQVLDGDAPDDGEQLVAATLWGFGQTLRTEHPLYRVTLLDLAPGSGTTALLDEVRAAEPDEFQLAYRTGERHVRRLRPSTAAAPITVTGDETYLITGGLGALGRTAARTLVDAGARHLALLSRRPAPDGEQQRWEAELGPGVRVTVLQGDAGNPEDVERIVDALKQHPHPVGGIVHAAGVLADAPVAAQTWDSVDAVFQSKVYGAWLLHQAASSLPGLRFFVGYSSIASVFGSPAQANYAAGNAYLDALMRWRVAQGLPGLSVNWGPWAGAGMAAGLDAAQVRVVESQGITFLKPADGMRALFTKLGGTTGQAVVGQFDWDRLTAGRPLADALYSEVATGGGVPAVRFDLEGLLAKPAAERRSAINAFIRATIAEVLQFGDADDVEPDAEFLGLGLDSLAAVVLKNALESALGIGLPASITFDQPSVRLLAGYLDQQLVPEQRTAQ